METSDNNLTSTYQFDHLLRPHAHTHMYTQSGKDFGSRLHSFVVVVGLVHTWYHCILPTGLCQEQKTEQRRSGLHSRLPGAGMSNIRTVPYGSPGGGPS